MSNTSRKFIAHRVFDLIKNDLISKYSESKIWEFLAETDDNSLWDFYNKIMCLGINSVLSDLEREINNA